MRSIIDTIEAGADAIRKLAQFCAFALLHPCRVVPAEKFFNTVQAAQASVRLGIEGAD